MRRAAIAAVLCTTFAARSADLESRVLTHYVPQDLLETMVRKEGWTELPLDVKGGLRKGDVVRVWAGGSIDWCNGDQPGENISGPAGLASPMVLGDARTLSLSPDASHAYAVLFKTETPGLKKCQLPGKPLEITLAKDKEKIWFGFNDLQGRYMDNHLGKGRRHELDPLWMRVEVVRIIVD
jgi:hypothetical protein